MRIFIAIGALIVSVLSFCLAFLLFVSAAFSGLEATYAFKEIILAYVISSFAISIFFFSLYQFIRLKKNKKRLIENIKIACLSLLTANISFFLPMLIPDFFNVLFARDLHYSINERELYNFIHTFTLAELPPLGLFVAGRITKKAILKKSAIISFALSLVVLRFLGA